MNEMRDNLQQEGITHWRNFFDLSVLVKSRSRRYRLMLNLVFSWFGQFSGNKSVTSYVLIDKRERRLTFHTKCHLILPSNAAEKCWSYKY